MNKELFYNCVLIYIVIIIGVCVFANKPTYKHKYLFLFVGIIGQFNLLYATYIIYELKSRTESVKVYLIAYLIYLSSFIMIDIFSILNNPNNWKGLLHNEHGVHGMITDFLYFNLANVSTIGVSDISAYTIGARLYVSYKLFITIIMAAFLLNDIIIKSN